MKVWLAVLTLITCILIGCSTVLYISTPKVGFVDSSTLIKEYEGMTKAQHEFDAMTQSLSGNADTLVNRYQRDLAQYKLLKLSLNKHQKDSATTELQRQQENIQRYGKIVEERILKEEKEILDGISIQMNAVIHTYGEENGFDLIFGSGTSGTLLYGGSSVDLTETILDVLNEEFYKKNE